MTESASGNATEYFRIQGISSGAVFTHFKSQPSGVSTWDGSCGTVIAQLIFEKRERRSSARNRERHEAKAREMKIERTASAAAGSARHARPSPRRVTCQAAATARGWLGARGKESGPRLCPSRRPLRRFLRVPRDKAPPGRDPARAGQRGAARRPNLTPP